MIMVLKKKRVFLDLGAGKIRRYGGMKSRLPQMAEREKAKKESRWRFIGVDVLAEPARKKNYALLKAKALDYLRKRKPNSVDIINSDLFLGSIYFEQRLGKTYYSISERHKAASKYAKELSKAEKKGAKEWAKKLRQISPLMKPQKEVIEPYLKEIKRVLKPNGRLYLTIELGFMPDIRQALAAESFKIIGAEEVSIPFGKKRIISPATRGLLESVRRSHAFSSLPIRLVAVKKA